ncbi:MerR family transcriptional regulator [Natronoglycomyces albus]|uniref:TipAS antibiotic-recognition domain-containing protein n=1 Tax=Natronoglycomyces albus TaxID=2811108 RepID=A0A895XYU5_9ACTN|nr:TipAS antibiotic-recognition domain-containing protein [Natronoglycomyces albus]QSB06778.1 TipAS antibiotic-recognition domain-containing protein [Natronoglycomyces albus]
MSWSTSQVASMAHLTARTLRHWDAIGLLRPAHTASTGLRYYNEEQLLRLQQILLLRRLGLPLAHIGKILDGDLDQVAALRRHGDQLRQEKERLEALSATVEATIRQLEGHAPMSPTQWFDGLTDETRAEYEAEARRRWGDQAVDDSHAALAALPETEQRRMARQWENLHQRLADLVDQGHSPSDAAIQELIAKHHALVSKAWTPERTSYIGLGAMYVEDPRFRATFDRIHPRLAHTLREGIDHFAHQHLNDA